MLTSFPSSSETQNEPVVVELAKVRADQARFQHLLAQFEQLLGESSEEEEGESVNFAGPQIIWSRSARGWRRAGWRPQNHRSSPYSAESDRTDPPVS